MGVSVRLNGRVITRLGARRKKSLRCVCMRQNDFYSDIYLFFGTLVNYGYKEGETRCGSL